MVMAAVPQITSLDTIPAHFAWLRRMREEQPVYRDPDTGVWHVFRHADVERVLTDWRTFSSEVPDAYGDDGGISILTMDPPRHRQLRGLISQAFTPRAVAGLAPRVAEQAEALLAPVRGRGAMDLIAEFADPLPVAVIAEIVGVPEGQRDEFKRWGDALVAVPESFGGEPDPAHAARLRLATERLAELFMGLIAERRAEPQADIMSALIAADMDGQHLSDAELVEFGDLLLIAGYETTRNLIGNAVYLLDAHPEAMDALRCAPEAVSGVVEETLRYLPPVENLIRVATGEAEIGEERIPAGALVAPWLAAANRDPARYPDPDRFLPARWDADPKPPRHLAFGHGIHACIGAPLARLEATIALPLLFAHLPDLHRDRAVPVETATGIVFGLKNLPVTFTPS